MAGGASPWQALIGAGIAGAGALAGSKASVRPLPNIPKPTQVANAPIPQVGMGDYNTALDRGGRMANFSWQGLDPNDPELRMLTARAGYAQKLNELGSREDLNRFGLLGSSVGQRQLNLGRADASRNLEDIILNLSQARRGEALQNYGSDIGYQRSLEEARLAGLEGRANMGLGHQYDLENNLNSFNQTDYLTRLGYENQARLAELTGNQGALSSLGGLGGQLLYGYGRSKWGFQ